MHIDNDLKTKAQAIRLLVLDVDGVLTDGKLYFGPDGTEIKAFNTLDGHGMKALQRSGVGIAIITGRCSEQTRRRAHALGVRHLIQGREDKYVALRELLQEHPLPLEQIAMMGDDWPDLSIMTHVGLSLTVPNAHPEVLQRAHWQSTRAGGEGAVREACDLLLMAQGNYMASLAQYTAKENDEE